MPLYEYACESCGKRTESIQMFSDPPLTTCEECGGPLKKLLSSPAVQFKGAGWYVNDYAKPKSESKKSEGGEGGKDGGKEKSAAASEGGSESKSESKGESKSETKTETKTESKS
ncbi:MAG: zinc ribbon domain-containing protein, partial [Acidobacteria bacterium]|nr:zinc ribbon domain-containing protein [Acidobacteriota bacterium]